MKDVRPLTSTFSAFLFAAALFLGGCAGNLTGPESNAASEKPVYRVDGQIGQEADRNTENGGGSTTTGASRNSSDD